MINILLELNKLVAGNFAARSAQANLATKIEIADFAKERDFEN